MRQNFRVICLTKCNTPNIYPHISETTTATNVRLNLVLLDDVFAGIQRAEAPNTIVLTSLFYYREINDFLSHVTPHVQIFGIHTALVNAALNSLRQFPAGHSRRHCK
jgi:hypothetical protein